MTAQLDAALEYHARGWCVIPAYHVRQGRCTCPKTNCTSAGKHPRLTTWKEYQTARPSEATIRHWWAQWPDANVAIVTGKISGIVVVDVDPRNGGSVSVKDLRLPPTVTCLTGGGGEHYYFEHPGGWVGDRAALLPGIDLRGDGGLVIAPPSNHLLELYRWEVGFEPDFHPLAPFPQTVNRDDPVREAQKPDFAVDMERWLKDGIPEGQRDVSLARIAGHAFAAGLGYDEALTRCVGLNMQLCLPPLPQDQVNRIARSIYQRDLDAKQRRAAFAALADNEIASMAADQLLAHARTAWEELGVRGVQDWYKATSVLNYEYILELIDRSVSLGDNLNAFPLVQRSLANATRVNIKKRKAAEWHQIVQKLLWTAREELAGTMRIADTVAEWTDAFCASAADVSPDEAAEKIKDRGVVRHSGLIQLVPSRLGDFIEAIFREKLTPRELGLRLRQAGWAHGFVTAKGGRQVRIWQRPLEGGETE